jgi:predicted GNAT superfamily acetyltransferase
MQLRAAQKSDFNQIVLLNQAEVRQTSALDRAALQHLHSLSCFHWVADKGDGLAGFVLAVASGSAYHNANFEWFSARYTRFIYVDRIVVGQSSSGQGVGRLLYDSLFAFARERNMECVVCEYNLQPPNPGSAAFHTKWGFGEVGQQQLDGGKKMVSMQMAAL